MDGYAQQKWTNCSYVCAYVQQMKLVIQEYIQSDSIHRKFKTGKMNHNI